MLTWCPNMIKTRDQHAYRWFEQKPGASVRDTPELYSALNIKNFRESLKQAYGHKSMQEKEEVIIEEENKGLFEIRTTHHTIQDELTL
jgi:hypothetical protein